MLSYLDYYTSKNVTRGSNPPLNEVSSKFISYVDTISQTTSQYIGGRVIIYKNGGKQCEYKRV